MCTEYIQDFGRWWKQNVVTTQLSPENVTVDAVKGVTVAVPTAQEGVTVEDVVVTQLSPEDVTVEAVKGVADQIAQEGVAVADQQQLTGVRDGKQETSLSTVVDSAAVHVKPTRNPGYH